MVVTEDLETLKWWAISLCVWPDSVLSRIAEIVLNKYSLLKPLGFGGMINFVLVVESEHSACAGR